MKKQWKGFAAGFMAAVLALGLSHPATAALVGKTIEVYTGVNIYVDDVKLDPRDANGNPVEVFVYNGTTYLPVRAVGEAVGKVVQWEGKTGSVYLGKHDSDTPAVYLQDLDYVTGKKLESISSAKDNLGQNRNNCIETHSFNNTYRINGQYRLMSGTLYQRYAYRDEVGKAVLNIYGDGNLIYSAAIERGMDPVDFTIDLTGVLELQVEFTVEWGLSFKAGIADCGLWT